MEGVIDSYFVVQANCQATIKGNALVKFEKQIKINCYSESSEQQYFITNENKPIETDLLQTDEDFTAFIEFANNRGAFRVRFTKQIILPTFDVYPEFLLEGRMRTDAINEACSNSTSQ